MEWFKNLHNGDKDFSSLPKIVGVGALVAALGSVFAMVALAKGIIYLGLAEIFPVWLLQVIVMAPWGVFMIAIVAAIVAVVAFMIIDLLINKNYEEYKAALIPWKTDNNPELTKEIFGS